jgi:hypothetical protein
MTVSSPTSARAYVDAHAGQVPPALIERVQAVLSADPAAEQLPVADALLKASTTLLGAVLADREAGREVALDLLAADACVTWAFEAAADAPASLPAQAELAMQRIADLAL